MKAAKTDGRQIFEKNIFPQLFDDAAQEAYIESTETYTKLFEDAGKYRAIMGALAHAMFDELQHTKNQEWENKVVQNGSGTVKEAGWGHFLDRI